jgi:hypothetical protein
MVHRKIPILPFVLVVGVVVSISVVFLIVASGTFEETANVVWMQR